MAEWLKKVNCKYVLVMCIGNVVIGLGVAIFKLFGLGNDPFSGMAMALANKAGIEYAVLVIWINLILFVVELLFGRKRIGLGTIINATLLGYFATFFYNLMVAVAGVPDNMAQRVIIVCIGVVVISLGVSLYQLPNQGVAPYDSLSLIMSERWPKIPYFWHRFSNDGLCAIICWLSGGIVGLGTVLGAFGLGPFIHFFNKHVTSKILERLGNRCVSEK